MPKLISAAIEGNVDVIRGCLDADPTCERDENGMTALMHAAFNGNLECVELLIPYEKGLRDATGWTALMHATLGGHLNCIEALLEESRIQSTNLKNDFYPGTTALMIAARRNWKNATTLLIKHEGGIRKANGWTALMVAVWFNSLSVVPLLKNVEQGLTDDDGWTALMHAAMKNRIEVLDILLDKEVGMQSTKKKYEYPVGTSALMIATVLGRFNFIEGLFQYEKGLKDASGHDVLWHAKNNSRLGVIRKPTISSEMILFLLLQKLNASNERAGTGLMATIGGDEVEDKEDKHPSLTENMCLRADLMALQVRIKELEDMLGVHKETPDTSKPEVQ
ncbi:Ankyrin repeat protein 1 [Giardia muris]|uniref:Ankyrin repeat protein 1 n=1 Tax=Giardia muris TaxID=5742 RepID=A0A4Z1SWR0_GIAMU|nr:Ankyrin repeat protein 1 [Giardia muris]|eukprot:TNJ27958.1 Ankyrin repeat protein 1 [Giardia muris]